MIVELSESFFFTLERTPGLDSRITLNPVHGEVVIYDNDGVYTNKNFHWQVDLFIFAEAVVGLERTSSTVLENVGVVEVCAIVYNPSLPCPFGHSFNVQFSTGDGSAGNFKM